MTRRIPTLVLALALCGCTTLTEPGGVFYKPGQVNKLARAVAYLEEGQTPAAEQLLTAICSEPGVPGVTDEALIRLSLLRLESSQSRNTLSTVQRDLERLAKEFPKSSWAPLASSLTDFIDAADELRQQDRKLRDSNLTLSKENKDLRQSIEKLKSLELEMGKGPRH